VTAPEPTRKKRPGLFVLAGCAGCSFLLLLAGVGGTMAWLLWQQNRGEDHTIPVAWHDSLRVRYKLPELAVRLAAAPAESGNAWTVIQGASRDTFSREVMRAARHLLVPGGLTREDSATIRSALGDSTAALAARAARQARYEPTALLDSSSGGRLMRPLGQGLWIGRWQRISGVTDPLVLRGEARRWRGDVAGARQDFAAVIALGRLAWYGEFSGLIATTGFRVIQDGAAGLSRLAAQQHDRNLAAAADSLRDWAVRPPDTWRLSMWLPPDSLLLIARDTALPRGVRSSAIENVCVGSLYRPFWRLVTGPSNRVQAGIRALTRDPDPYVARVAEMGDSTLSRLDRMGIRNRYRVASGKSVR